MHRTLLAAGLALVLALPQAALAHEPTYWQYPTERDDVVA